MKPKLRNKHRVYEYHLEHPRMSYAAIGRVFHVSRERVRQIINEYKINNEKDSL